MKKIYISGKITGLVYEEAFELFESAEEKLSNQGFSVVNPMKLEHNHDLSWESYMKEDLKAMLDCTHVYALKNHENSVGAMLEVELAEKLGIKVIYE